MNREATWPMQAVVSPTDFARRIGRTPKFVYSQIKKGQLQARKVGARWYLPVTELARFTGETA